jgi:hypothetical protein
MPTSIPGDFDGDGDVDGGDFLAWQRGLGTSSATIADGDADGDGDVDDADLAQWASHYGDPEAAAAVTNPAAEVEFAQTSAWDVDAWLVTERSAPTPHSSGDRRTDSAFATWTSRRMAWPDPPRS